MPLAPQIFAPFAPAVHAQNDRRRMFMPFAALSRRRFNNATRIAIVAFAAASLAACGDRHTGSLTAAQEKQFADEGVVRRADDLDFRYTSDPRGRNERWENRRASIIVTKSTVLIHKNAKVGLEITPAARRDLSVERTADRIRIHSGRGKSEEVWSFVPPGDAPGWATDIRAVIKSTRTPSSR